MSKLVSIVGIALLLAIFFGVIQNHPTKITYSAKPVLIFKKPHQEPTKILFVGDMFFDRYIRLIADREGEEFIFSCVDGLLKNADLVVGNLEGPITGKPSVSLTSKVGSPENFVFTFPLGTAALLARHNVKLVNLGNNHISNFGREGINSTKTYLQEAGVNFFGGLVGDEPIYQTEINKIPISFISYNQFGGYLPQVVAQKIYQEKSLGRTVFVYAHWGEEYSDPTAHMKETAKLFAQNGADVIIGSHPHIVLGSEHIDNAVVYYSLGNFIFDQYWDEKVSKGLTVMITLNGEDIVAEDFPIILNRNGQTCLI